MNRDVKIAIRAAVAGAVALAAASAIAADKPAQEKCYGVAAAHQNDCATASNSCAGTAGKDRQVDAFVYLPKGLCQKIAGGTTTAPAKKG
ncbi:MAG TPA: DUF2282 domain-containing protein [Gammaproteobacteria bacterium]|nr:DUF2282 domain-containing protein [Gammaproteobacteria bacterium]